MKFVSKAAAFGAAAAISATGLVAATGTTADAATVSVNYNCDLSQFGPLLGGQPTTQTITAAYAIPAFPSTLPGLKTVPATPITAKITVPPAVSAIITGGFGGHISGSVNGNAKFGAQAVASKLTIPDQTIPASTPPAAATVNASGTLASFTPKTAGANAFSLPASVTATLSGATVSCVADSSTPVSLGSIAVTPEVLATAPKKVKAGKAVKIQVTSTTLTGKVVAKIKKKKVGKATLSNGTATLKVKKGLKKGKNKIVVSVGSLKQTVKVKVK
ncbi:hypothetical protein P5P86_16400 [Nocardioides sp. BP30]|uniref:hypothetical protein n=1 Tax=Nocardioides sp. BP30 TaxID=3036374 RepID=UPI002468BC16|nr:hypothetical protein [Nocardioides sp. BP30]WGL51535.1 hypothetical protein P5P86_16400 [Nocardioides sp. BP30]